MLVLKNTFSRDFIQCFGKFLQKNILKPKLKIYSLNLREKNKKPHLQPINKKTK